MAPPVFMTTGREASSPPSPSTARALEQWLAETFDAALFETQQGRVLRFVRAERQPGVGVALVLSKNREPVATDEVLMPFAALGDVSVSPCIAKIYLFLFDVPVHGANGEITAKRTRADGDSISKIIVVRAPTEGSGTTRATQSTLTVASFLSQISHKLSQTRLRLQADAGPGGTQETRPDVVSWATFTSLVDLARAADVFQSAEPALSWADAEEFLTAALGRPVQGKTAVLGAAARLNAKLTTQTSVRTAVAAAVDAARECQVALTMRDKGEIVAAQGIQSATASPARRQQPAPAAAPAAPVARPAQGEDEAADEPSENEESSGSTSSSESYESDTASGSDRPARKRKKKGNRRDKRKKKRKRKKSRSDKSARRQRRPDEAAPAHAAFSPGADLAKLTPAGMRASQVARVLFNNPTLAKAAQYDEQAPESDDDGEGVAQRRAAFAIRRLTTMCGTSWIPDEPVASAAELRNVREHAAHLVASRSAGVGAGAPGAQLAPSHAAGPSSSRLHPIDVDDEERTVTLSTGAAALAPEQQVGAVLPDVVERLHEHSARLAYSQGEDVGAGIRSAPENLRADLARAVGSNGKVDAAGERKPTRCTMPSVVLRMYSTLVEEVHDALRKLPMEDESGSQHMSMKAARKLAEAAVWGYFHVSDYIKETGRTFGPRNAPKSGSLAELKHAWRYIKEALITTASALYGMRATDAGVTKVDNRLTTVVGTLRLDVFDVRVWLGRVLESWEREVARFRRGLLSEVPAFADCVAAHEEYFRLLSFTASMALRSESSRQDKRGARFRSGEGEGGGSRSRGRRHQGDRSPDDDDDDSSEKPKSTRKRSRGEKSHSSKRDSAGRSGGSDGQAPKKTSTVASAWPSKPRMGAEQFEEFKKEVREKCGDTCNFFLVTSCKREKCKYSHDIPAAFHEIKAKYAA